MNSNLSETNMYLSGRKTALVISDILLIGLAFLIASIYRLNTVPNFISFEYIGLSAIILTTLFIGGAYNSSFVVNRPKLPLNTFFIVLSATLPSLLFIYILGPLKFTALFGRGLFPLAIISFGVLSVLNRYVINNIFHNKKNNKTILLLGDERSFTRIEGLLLNSSIKLKLSSKFNTIETPPDTLTAIVLSPEHKPDNAEQQALIKYRLAGIAVYSLSDFFENFLYLIPVQAISNDWFIRSEGFTMLHNSASRRAKRTTDIFSAILLFLLTLPITLITIYLIRISSPGPIFFSQTRVGKHGSEFKVYKFRTMRTDAESEGAQWASTNDSRIITGGHFLRKTRIDEIPQCWNILKGEMSFIGPRPERPEFTQMLNKEIPYYDLRHVVKPGLTGWAQVKYPYGASTEDSLRKLQYDLYYIKNYSLLLDLNIVLRTVKVILLRGGR